MQYLSPLTLNLNILNKRFSWNPTAMEELADLVREFIKDKLG